jgi:AtzE family amidohydrolase
MRQVRHIAEALQSGATTAGALVEETIERILQRDPWLNCFTGLCFERARTEAAAVDDLRRQGKPLPPLAGVPYAVKNLFDVKGEVTLAGGRINQEDPPATRDSLLVARMRDAGAILMGMLNMDEHAYGFTTENTAFGPTHNPHDSTRIAGGSSGGSAAAVAARLVPLTLGSDTNGSIRVPASLCGVFGLKPTYGRLPRLGSYPFVHSLDHLGPFASSVHDLAAVYDVLQGPAAEDQACVQRPLEPVLERFCRPRRLRVGVLGGWFHCHASRAARDAVRLCAQALEAERNVEWSLAEAARSAAFIITGSEGGSLHRERLRTRYDEFEPLSRDRLVAGSLIPADWLVRAQRVRALALEEFKTLFDEFDVLLAPATPVVAPTIGSTEIELHGKLWPARASMGLLAQPLSCIGVPVCTVPVWPESAGPLPLGVQIVAAPWREDLCLAAAYALEQKGVAKCGPGPTH